MTQENEFFHVVRYKIKIPLERPKIFQFYCILGLLAPGMTEQASPSPAQRISELAPRPSECRGNYVMYASLIEFQV